MDQTQRQLFRRRSRQHNSYGAKCGRNEHTNADLLGLSQRQSQGRNHAVRWRKTRRDIAFVKAEHEILEKLVKVTGANSFEEYKAMPTDKVWTAWKTKYPLGKALCTKPVIDNELVKNAKYDTDIPIIFGTVKKDLLPPVLNHMARAFARKQKRKIHRVTCFRSRDCCHPITRLSIPATFGMRSARLGIPYDLLRKTITTCPMKWLTDFQLLQNRKIPTPTANRNGLSIHQNPTSKFSNKFI